MKIPVLGIFEVILDIMLDDDELSCQYVAGNKEFKMSITAIERLIYYTCFFRPPDLSLFEEAVWKLATNFIHLI